MIYQTPKINQEAVDQLNKMYSDGKITLNELMEAINKMYNF